MTEFLLRLRARNAGFERVRQLAPDRSYVQFVDGDCEIVAGRIERAAAFLDAHRDVAVWSASRASSAAIDLQQTLRHRMGHSGGRGPCLRGRRADAR